MTVRAIRITLMDLGGALRLEAVDTVLGVVPGRVALVAGAGPVFGPFSSPLCVTFGQQGIDVEVRLHSVGAVAVRVARDVESPWEPADLPDTAQWHAAIAGEVAHALYDRYSPPEAIEAWEVRLLDSGAMDIPGAENFILRDAPPILRPVFLARGQGGVMLGRDRAVAWAEPDDVQDVLDILELARAELLEFRAYDGYLDRRLDAAYHAVDRLWARGGLFRSARAALRDLSQVRVEVARLTDPLYGTGKAFGDRFSERLHATAQERLRIDEWEQAVDHKTDVLEDMLSLAQEETHHRRAMVLEAMIVILFILDLIILVRVEA